MPSDFDLNFPPPLSPHHATFQEDIPNAFNGPGDINTEESFDLNQLPAEDYSFNVKIGHPTQTEATNHHQVKRNMLSGGDRIKILLWQLERATRDKLKRGVINEAAQEFQISRKTIGSIWNKAKHQRQSNKRYNLTPQYNNSDRKRIEIPREAITELGMGDKSCIRDLACKINVSKSTTHMLIKRGIIKPHTNVMHPGLKEANKVTTLEWILKHIEELIPMFDYVHIDEKWFYLSKNSHRCYLEANEVGKYRSASSSKFIPKVMFAAAVARPRFNSDGHCTFDGKIEIFPFTYHEPAKRSSKSRQKGTIIRFITKLVDSVNQKFTRTMLITQILLAIKDKWPQEQGQKVIFIQQDNARAHINAYDSEWRQVYQHDDFTFILTQQPPKNPDLNILDLGFFRSIQSLMHKKMPRDVDDMLDAVNMAFYELDLKTLANVWMSLQYVMLEILKHKEGNDFDLPHASKAKKQALRTFPILVEVSMRVFMQGWDTLQAGINIAGPSNVIHHADNETEDIDGMESQIADENMEIY